MKWKTEVQSGKPSSMECKYRVCPSFVNCVHVVEEEKKREGLISFVGIE
jgi:hypothetical protein